MTFTNCFARRLNMLHEHTLVVRSIPIMVLFMDYGVDRLTNHNLVSALQGFISPFNTNSLTNSPQPTCNECSTGSVGYDSLYVHPLTVHIGACSVPKVVMKRNATQLMILWFQQLRKDTSCVAAPVKLEQTRVICTRRVLLIRLLVDIDYVYIYL